jgi:hypothetical protein
MQYAVYTYCYIDPPERAAYDSSKFLATPKPISRIGSYGMLRCEVMRGVILRGLAR